MEKLSKKQIYNKQLINSGKVLQTHCNTKSFKFLGELYTTNPRRSKKRPYSFDDGSWRVTNLGVLYKIKSIFTGKAYKFTQ